MKTNLIWFGPFFAFVMCFFCSELPRAQAARGGPDTTKYCGPHFTLERAVKLDRVRLEAIGKKLGREINDTEIAFDGITPEEFSDVVRSSRLNRMLEEVARDIPLEHRDSLRREIYGTLFAELNSWQAPERIALLAQVNVIVRFMKGPNSLYQQMNDREKRAFRDEQLRALLTHRSLMMIGNKK